MKHNMRAPHGAKTPNAGFTLLELLVSVTIIAMLAFAVRIGIGVYTKLDKQTSSKPEAGVLASTLQTIITDELRFAKNVRTSSEKVNEGTDAEETFEIVDKYASAAAIYGADAAIDIDDNGMLIIKSLPNPMPSSVPEPKEPVTASVYGKALIKPDPTASATLTPIEGANTYSIVRPTSDPTDPTEPSTGKPIKITYYENKSKYGDFLVKFNIKDETNDTIQKVEFWVRHLNPNT